jgi:hypothetical protein
MAKRASRSKFREFKMREEYSINKSYLKYFNLAMRDLSSKEDLSIAKIHFMLFAYDYMFFTLKHISEAYFYSKIKMGQRLIYPLMQDGYVYKYFDRLSPTSYEEALFNESQYNYRVRYALTQKGRHLVQKFYRKLEGLESINVPI